MLQFQPVNLLVTVNPRFWPFIVPESTFYASKPRYLGQNNHLISSFVSLSKTPIPARFRPQSDGLAEKAVNARQATEEDAMQAVWHQGMPIIRAQRPKNGPAMAPVRSSRIQ